LPDNGSAEKLLGLENGDFEFDDEEEYTNGHSPVPPGVNGPDDTLPHAAE